MLSKPLFTHLALIWLTAGGDFAGGQTIDFESQIQPIFEENCSDCHGEDKVKSGFRVDQRPVMLKGGDSGLKAIVPGQPEKSFLMEVIQKPDDPDYQMPPKGDPLAPEQIALIKQWIEEGAQWPGQMEAVLDDGSDHWSFQTVVRPQIPGDSAQVIDAFLNRKLAEAGITPNEPATPPVLLRRLAITLTGLPPTFEEIQAFEEAYAQDAEKAYSDAVERLLASPHFGERWAQHWLDVIRWAETNGSEANLYRKNAHVYRDYVTRSFNENKPYHQFIIEQLAGDQLGTGEATGFLVAGPHVPAATVGAEATAIRQARADRLDEMINTLGASVLGVTVSCARCHNHKFDPISIQDYYSLSAVLQGVEFGARFPEYDQEHPKNKRAREIREQMKPLRQELSSEVESWAENWGGFTDFHFPATTTKKVRLEFAQNSVRIDELQFFGPQNPRKNLALASEGTTVVEDETLSGPNSRVWKVNDGQFGTKGWSAKARKGSQGRPWIEITFPQAVKINRLRFSSNREYFFETDYLTSYKPGDFPDYILKVEQDDGSWSPLGSTSDTEQAFKTNPTLGQTFQKLHGQITRLQEEGPQPSFVGRFVEPVVTKVLLRGSPETPRDIVPPAGFEIMDGDLGLDNKTPESERRLKYAQWLVRKEHPLTSRVMVNRIWHHIFGSGIVATGSDFGLAGAPPTHPELLDWLAAEFMNPTQSEQDWSVKDMIRLLVKSDAFRRSSHPNQDSLAKDGLSQLLWRFPPRRVEAEVIRDSILQASGKLDPTLGGRSFRIHNVKATYAQWQVEDNYSSKTWRRMLYQERMRRVDDQIFTAFDFPDCGQVRAKRPVSTTPLQALNLMNSPFVVDQSNHLAQRAIAESGDEKEVQVRRAFQLLLARQPSSDELAATKNIDLLLVCRSLINSNEFSFLP
ncbi:MAG: PSD1 and planctomycete cytochrome C domain-containing protein [Roseibacillus sp.]